MHKKGLFEYNGALFVALIEKVNVNGEKQNI